MRIFWRCLFISLFCTISLCEYPVLAETDSLVMRPRSSYCQAIGSLIQQKWKKRRGFDEKAKFDIELDAQGQIQQVVAVDEKQIPPAVLLAGKRFFNGLKNFPPPPSASGESLWLRVVLSNASGLVFVRYRNIDMGPWLADARRRIMRAWFPPKDGPGGSTIIFKVHEDGRVSDIRFVKGSGFKCVDDAALKAISSQGSFRPLPEGIPGEIDLCLRFDEAVRVFNGSVRQPITIVSDW